MNVTISIDSFERHINFDQTFIFYRAYVMLMHKTEFAI
jgi:hypothetical protein